MDEDVLQNAVGGDVEVTGTQRMAVIGAGAAGLCSAKHLLERGFDVTVFELGSKVGGLWVYENDNERSPAYLSLRINSEPRTTQYRDFPFPEDYPFNPTHYQVRAYLEAYADHFDVRRHIQFNTEVVSVEPSPSTAGAAWQVRLADGTEEHFDGVVVASGHQGMPSHPPFAAKFTGEYLHSHEYRRPEPFRGKRVLVLGTGNSGLDIAADICTEATISTTLSARSPVLIMPRMVFGVPISRVLAKIEKPFVPWAVARRFRELITWMAHGPNEEWGFVKPRKRTHPASHPNIISHIAWERIEVKPGVDDVEGNEAHFADGTVESFDTMIAATGYEIDLPFLSEDIVPVTERRLNLFKRVVPSGWPGLYFVGFHNVSGGANIKIMDVQAEWVAAIASGDVGLPDQAEMVTDIERENRRVIRRYPDSPRYGLELDPPLYVLDIEEELHPDQRWLRLRRAARKSIRDITNDLHRDSRQSSEDWSPATKLAALGLVATGVTTVVGLLGVMRRR